MGVSAGQRPHSRIRATRQATGEASASDHRRPARGPSAASRRDPSRPRSLSWCRVGVMNADYSESDVSGGSTSTGRANRGPFRMAARRSSSSRGSVLPPQPRTKSNIPVDIESLSTSCAGLGAPRLAVVRRGLPTLSGPRSPSPNHAWAQRKVTLSGEDHSFEGFSTPEEVLWDNPSAALHVGSVDGNEVGLPSPRHSRALGQSERCERQRTTVPSVTSAVPRTSCNGCRALWGG